MANVTLNLKINKWTKAVIAIIKEYGEIPIRIMQSALLATADMILERDPKENYAFKILLKPYKNKEL